MKRPFAGLYRDDPRQPQPRKPRPPKPPAPPKTREQKLAEKLAKAHAMVKLWSRKSVIAAGRLRGWHRAVASLERQIALDPAAIEAARLARLARAAARKSKRALRKITLEG